MLIAHDQTVACPIKRKKCISLYFRMSNQSFFYSTYLIFLLAFMYFKHKEKITFFFFLVSNTHFFIQAIMCQVLCQTLRIKKINNSLCP